MQKEYMISTGYFLDNEYFDKYIKLIDLNKETCKQSYKTQVHHVIPKHYYTQNNIDIDNSPNNLVNLTYKDHMLAHIYLSGCTIGRNKYWNLYAVFRMSHFDQKSFDEIQNNLECYQNIYEEAVSVPNHRKGCKISETTRLKMQESQKLRVQLKGCSNKGYMWVHNDTKEYMIPKSELDEYIENGFVYGRLYRHSSQTKKVIGEKSSRWERDENFKKKMSEIASKQVHTEEQNKKHSEWMKEHFSGKDNPFYGKHHSNESKEKISLAKSGKIAVNKEGNVKMISPSELEFYISEGYSRGYGECRNKRK